jgi:hypothetical protein
MTGSITIPDADMSLIRQSVINFNSQIHLDSILFDSLINM